jgi:ABC-2 type transport system permease protein
VTTFVPVTAPFVVPVRAAFGVLPVWQHILAVLVALVAVVGLMWIGGRVYAGGALRFGGKIGWREAYRSAEG